LLASNELDGKMDRHLFIFILLLNNRGLFIDKTEYSTSGP